MEIYFASDFETKRRNRLTWKRILFFVISIAILSSVVFFLHNRKKPTINVLSSTATSPTATIQLTPTVPETKNRLKRSVEEALDGATGTYAIAVRNLKTGEEAFINEHVSFEAGSLYKLWIMAIIYKEIQSGQLTKDQVLSQDVSTLNQEFSIDPENAELTDGTITLTVQDALTQMITISHNYAALLLTERIGLPEITSFLKENGFTESKVGENGESPTTTASDTALFFQKLYKDELANTQYTDEMIGLLKKQQFDEGLPKYLPKNTVVANKTGDIDLFKHDAGIIFADSGAYSLVVLSKSEYPPGAQERIALISKAVFDYFLGKK